VCLSDYGRATNNQSGKASPNVLPRIKDLQIASVSP
jgi:hypothetical protein